MKLGNFVKAFAPIIAVVMAAGVSGCDATNIKLNGEEGKPLSELRRVLVKYPQLSVALAVKEKKSLDSLRALTATITAVETELGSDGRVLVRYSGTEPKLRLLVEGPTDAVVQAAMARLQAAARADLEVL